MYSPYSLGSGLHTLCLEQG